MSQKFRFCPLWGRFNAWISFYSWLGILLHDFFDWFFCDWTWFCEARYKVICSDLLYDDEVGLRPLRRTSKLNLFNLINVQLLLEGQGFNIWRIILWMVPKGSEGVATLHVVHKELQKVSKRFRKVTKGSERYRKVLKGFKNKHGY